MKQKYRLEIPEKINKEDAPAAVILAPHQYDILEEDPIKNGSGLIWIKEISKDWLKPIQDKPITAKEYIISNYVADYNPDTASDCNLHHLNDEYFSIRDVEEAFVAGGANDRKRTQPYLEKYRDLLESIMNSRKGSMGSINNVYCGINFDRGRIDNQHKALKQLEQKNNQ